MPFDQNTKARMFIKSARICCLCHKQCGVNIEAAHIVDESKGGTNDDDNGIPLCFDCHQEIGGYRDDHPKGNKFSQLELKSRRDKVYSLVDNGVLQAQIIYKKIQQNKLTNEEQEEIEKKAVEYKPTKEIIGLIESAKKDHISFETFPLKLKLLNEQEQAYIIDELVAVFNESNIVNPLFAIITSDILKENGLLILEQILRKVTISMDLNFKKDFTNGVPIELFKTTDVGLRSAFFTELIEILGKNQFLEINTITPPLIRVQDAIPEELKHRYMYTLLHIVNSGAYTGRPAAKEALISLSKEWAIIALKCYDIDLVCWYRESFYKDVAIKYKNYWNDSGNYDFLNDYTTLTDPEFRKKYAVDE